MSKFIKRFFKISLLLLACNLQPVYPQTNSKFIPILSLLLLDGESPLIYECEASFLADLNGSTSNGSNRVNPQFTNLEDKTVFFVDHSNYGGEPWVTDGTAQGTHLLKDIWPGTNEGIFSAGLLNDKIIERVGNTVYFLANNGQGESLWKTDGTSSGTVLVKDITTNTQNPGISNLTAFNNKLYFLVSGGDIGSDDEGLWESNGTTAGTKLVKDVHPFNSTNTTEAGSMVVLNNKLIFASDSENAREEVWVSDGTTAGTQLLKDINPGPDSSYPEQFTSIGNFVYFIANDGTHGKEVWVTDGTTAGTKLLKDINPGTARGAEAININYTYKKNPGFNNKLYFVANSSTYGRELWVSDGTTAGTKIAKDINPGTSDAFNQGSFRTAELFNNKFYFQSQTTMYGLEVWQIDTTGVVSLTKDLNPGTSHSFPEYLVGNEDYLFFSSDFSINVGVEPTIMDKDGRVHQLNLYNGSSSSNPDYLHVRNDQSVLFTTANSFIGPGVGLYSIKCPNKP